MKLKIDITREYIMSDDADPMEIINPVWWKMDIYDSYDNYLKSVEQFTKLQRYVVAVEWYESEVSNGGHDQFYSNSTGIVWEDVLNCFKMFDDKRFADILQKSAEFMGGRPSFVRKERWEQQEAMSDEDAEKFDGLDDWFYNICGGLKAELLKLIRANIDDFVYSGYTEIEDKAAEQMLKWSKTLSRCD